jgi:energy-coupling factor transporter ATP-binding protein EcfA2
VTLTEIDDGRQVVGLPWERFLEFMRDAWEPGQHLALIGPTGEGKSTFAGGLLNLRNWVLALDPKGEDETLSATGFTRVARLPNELTMEDRMMRRAAARQWDAIHQAIAEGKPARVIVGQQSRTIEQDIRNQTLMSSALSYAREAGGWTVYVDEFELLSSQRMFRQGPMVERMLISARSAGTSVVTSYQAQAWVSKHATRQARMAVVWQTGSRQMIKAIAEDMGRDWRELGMAIDELPRWHVLVVPRGPKGGPFICTSAPKL